MTVEIDLGNFAKIGALPPVGTYRFEILGAGHVKPNSKKDGHNIVLPLRIVDSWDEDFENFNLTIWVSLKTTVRWKLKEALEAMTGEPWDDEETKIRVDDENENQLEYPTLSGKTFVGNLVHGNNGGKPVANVQNFFIDDGSIQLGPAEVDADV